MPRFQICGVIGFCAKAYPFYKVNLSSQDKQYMKTYYSIAHMEQDIMGNSYQDNVFSKLNIHTKATHQYFMEEIKSLRRELSIFLNPNKTRYYYYSSCKITEFDNLYVGKSLSDELFIKYNAPILLVYESHWGGTITLNPRLNEFNFITKYDPIAAFQEIAMYIGNNLAKQVDPTTNFSDDLKINSHGFDKWSFRKHKEDK